MAKDIYDEEEDSAEIKEINGLRFICQATRNHYYLDEVCKRQGENERIQSYTSRPQTFTTDKNSTIEGFNMVKRNDG